jgi:predicted metal-dependent hydrolase
VNTPQDVIRDFAASRIRWIEKYREKFRQNPEAKNRFLKDEIHFIWGAAYSLEPIEKTGRPKIVLEDKTIKFFTSPGTSPAEKQQILDRWYHRIIKEAAPGIIRKWEPLIGVTVKNTFFRKMKTHWGSCNYQKKTIRLNTELAKKPPNWLEYVIVHEMIHIIEPSHNRSFYQLMNAYIPDWKIIRKKMNAGEI